MRLTGGGGGSSGGYGSTSGLGGGAGGAGSTSKSFLDLDLGPGIDLPEMMATLPDLDLDLSEIFALLTQQHEFGVFATVPEALSLLARLLEGGTASGDPNVVLFAAMAVHHLASLTELRSERDPRDLGSGSVCSSVSRCQHPCLMVT